MGVCCKVVVPQPAAVVRKQRQEQQQEHQHHQKQQRRQQRGQQRTVHQVGPWRSRVVQVAALVQQQVARGSQQVGKGNHQVDSRATRQQDTTKQGAVQELAVVVVHEAQGHLSRQQEAAHLTLVQGRPGHSQPQPPREVAAPRCGHPHPTGHQSPPSLRTCCPLMPSSWAT